MADDERQYQVFRAELSEDIDPDIQESPWFVNDEARIPLEHWDALQELADEKHFVDWDLWEDMSCLDEVYCELEELQMFVGGLKQLQKFLRRDMAVMLMRTSHCPEPLPGSEHARMIEAVLKILELASEEVESFVE